jgi:transcriptional regulator with XRE-family HTH domain
MRCAYIVAMTPEQIKSFRDSREWSQQELATRLGVDQATVSRIERGAAIARPVAMLLERLMSEPAPEPRLEAAS